MSNKIKDKLHISITSVCINLFWIHCFRIHFIVIYSTTYKKYGHIECYMLLTCGHFQSLNCLIMDMIKMGRTNLWQLVQYVVVWQLFVNIWLVACCLTFHSRIFHSYRGIICSDTFVLYKLSVCQRTVLFEWYCKYNLKCHYL